jgi:hypothetical protein
MELDAGCGDIETSPVNAAMGVDEVFTPLGSKTGMFDAPPLPPVHMGSRGSKGIGTNFTSQTTNNNPPLVLPLMTEKSAAQAKKAAPRSAFKTHLEEK